MRVNIVGTSGSGKTTFGRQLAEILQVPFIELDALFWGPDWYFPEDEEFFPVVQDALAGSDWVLDGNYSRTTPIKWDRVQAVIWLDYSFPRTLYQAITRAFSRIISQKELWPGTGNRETLGNLFSRDSIVLYTITSYRRKRTRLEATIVDPQFSHIKFHRLRSPAEAKELLHEIQADQGILIPTQTG